MPRLHSAFALAAVLSFITLSLPARPQPTPRQRHFTFHYAFAVNGVPAGKPLRIWIPAAHSDQFQVVHILSRTGTLNLRQTVDARDNTMLYGETRKATRPDYQFAIDYDVVRYERIALVNGKLVPGARPEHVSPAVQVRYLQPDRLVPTSGVPAQIAADQTRDAATPLAKARAIYDYVFRTMRYDKSGTGWGHGDTLWACDSKRGNCTDFHSVFLSMARSQQIPARFSIGFSLPADQHSAEIPGYHCWAEFYLDQLGWIPVDISEAWKHPELKNYFFGAHDANRFQLTTGRDLTLNPPQAGPPLNYFVYPYVEVDRKDYSNVSMDFSFRDLEAQATSSGTAK